MYCLYIEAQCCYIEGLFSVYCRYIVGILLVYFISAARDPDWKSDQNLEQRSAMVQCYSFVPIQRKMLLYYNVTVHYAKLSAIIL